MEELALFWFRRDLRVEDNTALFHALTSGFRVLPVYIYDPAIIDKLERTDRRISFLKDILSRLREKFISVGSTLLVFYGDPVEVFRNLSETYRIRAVYYNRDYEPYAQMRDREVAEFLAGKGTPCFRFKDQIIF